MKLVLVIKYPLEDCDYDTYSIPVEYESKEKLLEVIKNILDEAVEGENPEFFGFEFNLDMFVEDGSSDWSLPDVLTLEEWFEQEQISR